MEIRDLEPGEYGKLAALFEQSRQKTFTVEQLTNMMARGYELWRARVLIYEGELIGCCIVTRFGSAPAGRYELRVDVHPAFTQQGFGSVLYQEGLDCVRRLGMTNLYCYVDAKSMSGVNFAKKKGFDIARESIESHLFLLLYMGQPFAHYVTECEAAGFRLASLAELGDTADHRYRLYELNKLCALDIPGRGQFFSYEEYTRIRLMHPDFTPEAVFIAIEPDQGRWVGMAAATYHKGEQFLFNTMTGVLRDYRGRGVAMALKVKVNEYGRQVGAKTIRTYNDGANTGMLAINRKLGYQIVESFYRMEKHFM